jgi:hypothetical protein
MRFAELEASMLNEPACSRCGGTQLEPGAIQATGRLYFRPANAKFLTFRTGDIAIHANVCIACGHVDLVADVKKLSSLTERAKPY